MPFCHFLRFQLNFSLKRERTQQLARGLPKSSGGFPTHTAPCSLFRGLLSERGPRGSRRHRRQCRLAVMNESYLREWQGRCFLLLISATAPSRPHIRANRLVLSHFQLLHSKADLGGGWVGECCRVSIRSPSRFLADFVFVCTVHQDFAHLQADCFFVKPLSPGLNPPNRPSVRSDASTSNFISSEVIVSWKERLL